MFEFVREILRGVWNLVTAGKDPPAPPPPAPPPAPAPEPEPEQSRVLMDFGSDERSTVILAGASNALHAFLLAEGESPTGRIGVSRPSARELPRLDLSGVEHRIALAVLDQNETVVRTRIGPETIDFPVPPCYGGNRVFIRQRRRYILERLENSIQLTCGGAQVAVCPAPVVERPATDERGLEAYAEAASRSRRILEPADVVRKRRESGGANPHPEAGKAVTPTKRVKRSVSGVASEALRGADGSVRLKAKSDLSDFAHEFKPRRARRDSSK